MKLQYVTWSAVCFTDAILRIQQVCQESPCHVLSHFAHTHAAEPNRKQTERRRIGSLLTSVMHFKLQQLKQEADWGANSSATDWDLNILPIDMPTAGCGSGARGVCLNACVRAAPKTRVWNHVGLFVCLSDGATPPLPAQTVPKQKTLVRSVVGFHARRHLWASSNVCTV